MPRAVGAYTGSGVIDDHGGQRAGYLPSQAPRMTSPAEATQCDKLHVRARGDPLDASHNPLGPR